jgi:hypothetical protein
MNRGLGLVPDPTEAAHSLTTDGAFSREPALSVDDPGGYNNGATPSTGDFLRIS